MGMYVCSPCIVEHQLTTGVAGTGVAICEICGNVKNDWTSKSVKWTNVIDRPIQELDNRTFVLAQIDVWKTHLASLEMPIG